MQVQANVVAGLFADRDRAKQAFDELRKAGFAESAIGVLARDAEAKADVTHHTETKAEEGGAYGAVAGGAVGAFTGWAVAAGLWVIPGIGPVLAAGALATILSGTAVGAAAGGLAGALIGYGVPEEEAHYYDAELALGKVLLTVHAGDRAAEATAILSRHGAQFRPVPVHHPHA